MTLSTHKFAPTPCCFLFFVWNYRLWRWGDLQLRHLKIDQLTQNLKWVDTQAHGHTHMHIHVACWSHKPAFLPWEMESRLKAYWKNKLCSNWTINIHKGSFILSFIQFLINNGSVHRWGVGGGDWDSCNYRHSMLSTSTFLWNTGWCKKYGLKTLKMNDIMGLNETQRSRVENM
jgi:hypothetical protein